MNLLLSWASGNDLYFNLPEFEMFLRTSRVVNAKKVMLSNFISGFQKERLTEYGFEVVMKGPVNDILTDRFLFFYQYLSETDFENVLYCDSRDVLFQSDPFQKLKSCIYLVDECIPSTSSGFHLIEQAEYQKDVPRVFKKNIRTSHVLNSGVGAGPTSLMKFYFLSLWLAGFKTPGVTDQGSLNYIYNFICKDPCFEIAPIDFCLTGEAVKDKFVTPYFDGKHFFVDEEMEQKYSIFHQWDRTKFREEILNA